jgi:EpsI family protein
MLRAWTPAALLAVGVAATLGSGRQQVMPLREPLVAVVPVELGGLTGTDLVIPDAQFRATRATAYVYRRYQPRAPDASVGPPWVTLYVGYYAQQTRGRTVHSPKNCLPGAGWDAIASERVTIATPEGPVRVNRYLVQRDGQRALVLYWYQGRDRVAASEYAVKWDLLRDAALRGRSEESLVRVVVPVYGSGDAAFVWAERVVGGIVPAVRRALPA